ncbi:MAG TPA: hypothetical protein VK071_07530 [Tissierellales bacterium]|nr:hypothetical protein [Tissierellales bacterium]
MNRILLITFIIGLIISIAFILPEENLGEKIKIGVSDDTSGFVVDYMIRHGNLSGLGEDEMEAYFIKDC